MSALTDFAHKVSKFYVLSIEPLIYKQRRLKRLQILGVTFNNIPKAELVLGDCDNFCCQRMKQRYTQYFQKYCYSDKNTASIAAVIDLYDFDGYQSYLKLLKKHSGNFYRIAQKARKSNYETQLFAFKNHSPDILAIHKSLKIRSFGLVISAFTLNIKDFGGVPLEFTTLEMPSCLQHWELFFGVFIAQDNYQQGNLVVNKKLVAYARLDRIGNTARYAIYMGHGDYMREGVMMLLHTNIIEWLKDNNNNLAQGVQFLSYGAIEQGNQGLFFWKRKALFKARLLVL